VALSALGTQLARAELRWLGILEAEEVINALLPGRGFEHSLYRSLVAEGILVEEVVWPSKRGREEVVVFIGYDRLADHLIAEALIEAHVDKSAPGAAFARGAPLGFFSDDRRYVTPGLIEAMCVQIPEYTGREFPALLAKISYWRLGDAFRQSIVWRSPAAFSEETRQVLNNLNRSDHGWGQTLDVLLTVATLPDHPFNAHRLDEILRRETMPERDRKWSIYVHKAWGGHTAVDRLVDWAWAQTPATSLDKESVDLCAIALAWMLSTSNRFLRDRATKALVAILTGRLDAVVRLIDRFADIDDLYITERVLAVAYGAVMRSHDPDQIGWVASAVYSRIFAGGNPPAHILLRDYARGVVERAVYVGSQIEIDLELIRPPYNSAWPTIPSEEEIKPYFPDWLRDAGDEGRSQWARNRIGSSVLDDDFARYIIGTNSGIASSLSLRLDEPPWRSSEEITEELLGQFSADERVAWEKYKAAEDALRRVSLGAWLTKLSGNLAGESEAVSISSLSSEELEEAEHAVRCVEEREAALAKLRSVIAPEHADKLEALVSPEKGNRRPPRFDLRLVQRYILWRVFDLGWRTERFDDFDRTVGVYDGREAPKAERIGKKYQWIAFHEILALIADHFQYRGDFRGPRNATYRGPWQDSLRNIDPSCTIRTTPGGTSWGGHVPAW
jgi:hypothetical protein